MEYSSIVLEYSSIFHVFRYSSVLRFIHEHPGVVHEYFGILDQCCEDLYDYSGNVYSGVVHQSSALHQFDNVH